MSVTIFSFSLISSEPTNCSTYPLNIPVLSLCINVCNDATFPIALTSGSSDISLDRAICSFSFVLYFSASKSNSPILEIFPTAKLTSETLRPSSSDKFSDMLSIPISSIEYISSAWLTPSLFLSCQTLRLENIASLSLIIPSLFSSY